MIEPDKFEQDLRVAIAEKRAAIERIRQELDRDERTLAARLDVSVRDLRKLLAADGAVVASGLDSETPEPTP